MSTWDANAAAMAADGVRVARVDAAWVYAQPTAPTSAGPGYNWSYLDAIAYTLARHGVQWLPIIDYTTTWSESVPGDLRSPPASDSAYAAYAAAFVARYGPGGSFWSVHPALASEAVTAVEIWNEENLPMMWGGSVNAAQYAAMYEAARQAIHAVNPSVEAIVGGLGNPAASYLTAMYQTLGGPGRIDAVADHPYDFSPSGVVSDVASLRQALDSAGDANVPIDVTEFGWPTQGSASWINTLTDSQRASYMTQAIQTLATSDCGVERIAPYSWSTSQANSYDTNVWFGVTNNGAATATSSAIAQEYGSLERAGLPASASHIVCARPLALRLASVSPPSGSVNNLCVRATVLAQSSAGPATVGIGGATVRFTAPAAQTVMTDASGQGTACWTLPPGTSETIKATATQPQFYPVVSGSLSVVTPKASTTTRAPVASGNPSAVTPTASSTTRAVPRAAVRAKSVRRRKATRGKSIRRRASRHARKKRAHRHR